MVFVWDSVRNRVSLTLISRVYYASQLEKFRVEEAFCERNAELLKTEQTILPVFQYWASCLIKAQALSDCHFYNCYAGECSQGDLLCIWNTWPLRFPESPEFTGNKDFHLLLESWHCLASIEKTVKDWKSLVFINQGLCVGDLRGLNLARGSSPNQGILQFVSNQIK